MKHYMTKYIDENNDLIVTSWLQINLFNRAFCFSQKKLTIQKND